MRRFDMELYETTKKDVEFVRDFTTPYPETGNFKVQVLVTGVVDEWGSFESDSICIGTVLGLPKSG